MAVLNGRMNGVAACFAAYLGQNDRFERQNERRRRMICRWFTNFRLNSRRRLEFRPESGPKTPQTSGKTSGAAENSAACFKKRLPSNTKGQPGRINIGNVYLRVYLPLTLPTAMILPVLPSLSVSRALMNSGVLGLMPLTLPLTFSTGFFSAKT